MSKHIEPERLVRFLLNKARLTEMEHEHLSKCLHCRKVMVENAWKQIKEPAESALLDDLSRSLEREMRYEPPEDAVTKVTDLAFGSIKLRGNQHIHAQILFEFTRNSWALTK